MASRSVVLFSLFALALSMKEDEHIVACPGDDRPGVDGKYTCNQDGTHRVCAKLVDKSGGTCTEHMWGTKDFWQVTGQTGGKAEWMDRICDDSRENKGEHWCICMWATADLINDLGCDAVTINCAATSIEYIMSKDKYKDAGRELTKEKECLEQKCKDEFPQYFTDATAPASFIDAGVQDSKGQYVLQAEEVERETARWKFFFSDHLSHSAERIHRAKVRTHIPQKRIFDDKMLWGMRA